MSDYFSSLHLGPSLHLGRANSLRPVQPSRILQGVDGPLFGVWRAWAAGMAFRDEGSWSLHKRWIVEAFNFSQAHPTATSPILQAELQSAIATGLYEEGDIARAIPSLENAESM